MRPLRVVMKQCISFVLFKPKIYFITDKKMNISVLDFNILTMVI